MNATLAKLLRNYGGIAPEAVQKQTRKLYEQTYCNTPLATHDGKKVVFKPIRFHHAFFSSEQRRSIPGAKDDFQVSRAERIDWIREFVGATIKGIECWEVPPECKGEGRQRLYVFWDPAYLVWLFDRSPDGFEFSTAYHSSTTYLRQKLKGISAKKIWWRA